MLGCGCAGDDDRLSGDHCGGWLPGHLHLQVGSEVINPSPDLPANSPLVVHLTFV